MSSPTNNIFADLLTNTRRPSHSFFHLDSDSENEDNDLSTLPFPQPLSRHLFSSPDFNTESFLLSHSQFRTLDDLRSELREWVDKLENEMETLIEVDWQGYVTLGRGLRGGETFVKDAERRIRNVEREITAVKQRIEERIREVDAALAEKRRIRQQADSVRRLLAVHSSLQNLEKGSFLLPDELLQMENSTSMSLYSTDRLQGLISQYRELSYFTSKIPSSHGFLQSQKPRIEKVKRALEKDIREAISARRKVGDTEGIFELLRLSRETDLQIITPINP